MTGHTAPAADDSATRSAAAEQLRAELEGLVRIAARRPGLTVRTGRAGCAWSFNWDTDVVTVDPEDLRSLAPDLCRGLALHEAAHAAVTVLHRILPPAVLKRLHPLLNAIEDIRIEIWMRSRFPGAAGWIRAYNDVIYGAVRSQTPPRSRQVQFLVGILDLWWYGTAATGTLPEVLAALDASRDAIAAATDCQPPLDADAAGILERQQAMWDIVREQIVPVWERLVALDRREGIDRLAARELAEFAERLGCGCSATKPGGSSHAKRLAQTLGRIDRRVPPSAGRQRALHSGEAGDASCSRARGRDSGSSAPCHWARATDADGYLDAWRRVARVADRLGDELLRVLLPRQRLRWSAGHPWGPRLDLRRAMQFQADPRHYSGLWSRPILPHRRDPAVLLLVDRSGSMERDDLIDRALEGTVLLTEVCRRIGVASAVWSFAEEIRPELDWNEPVSGVAQGRLGALRRACGGNTNMAAAIALAGREFAARHGDPKLLFVISDGQPDDHAATLAAVRRLEADGIVSVGLGLGHGTSSLASYFPTSVTEIPPEQLVDHVADLLGSAILAHT